MTGKVLIDGKGGITEAAVGLVDRDGAFLLLVDSNETRHYRFADEASCVSMLMGQVLGQKAEVENLRGKLDSAQVRARTLAEALDKAKARIAELESALGTAGAAT